MKKGLLLITAAVLAISLVLAACAAPSPAPSPTPSPTPAPAVETIKLKYSCWSTTSGSFGAGALWLLDEIEKRTQGKVKFDRIWGGTLIPQGSEVEGVGGGIADITTVNSPAVKARLSLIDVSSLPGACPTTLKSGPALAELVNSIPAIKQEFAKNNLTFVGVMGGSPSHIFTNFPMTKLEDLKGKKIRAPGDSGKAVEAAGAVSVGIASAELYDALSKKTIDGVVIGAGGGVTWKVYEASKYYVLLPVFNSSFYSFMNTNSWNKLPADIQKVIAQVGAEQANVWNKVRDDDENNNIQKVFPAAGVQIVNVAPEEVRKLTAISKPILDAWVAAEAKAGLPGQETLDAWLKLGGLK
jgi:TRAP-type C4-dicarboxylate transport system substrate-binding protein